MRLELTSLAAAAAIVTGAWLIQPLVAQSQAPAATSALAEDQSGERRIWNLLDEKSKPFVSLAEEHFRALGGGFELPDGGKTVTALALKAPGGAFDPRDVAKIPASTLGYKADWIVERYKRYNLEWDITGLRLTSLSPDASRYPWVFIINGGAANMYEFYVDLKNRPGWTQYLAQKLNVMVVTIPGNFKYGGWEEPVDSEMRQPAYLLDRDLSMKEYEVRNAVMTNNVVMQGLKALITKHTSGDILIVGHSTSGELGMMANDDPELRARLKGRYLGWGSGGPARLLLTRQAKLEAAKGGDDDEGGARGGTFTPLHRLSRRNVPGYARTYSLFLNPMYEPGMSTTQIAERWLQAESRRRPNFKQQLQQIEHSAALGDKGRVEAEIERILKESGNAWGVNIEDVNKDLFSSYYTRMDGYNRMVWTVAHYDRNHWLPEDPMQAREVFIANEYRARNPNAEIRIIVWDPPMTHYGHLELPRPLAAATYSVVRWLMK
jgi:hypothetical protein